jgi:hypothetical protein
MTKYIVTAHYTFEFEIEGEYNEDDAIQHAVGLMERDGGFIYNFNFDVEEVDVGDDQEDDE